MVLIAPETPDRPTRPESAKQQVYRLLKADIVRGVFDMGERLNEGQLALRYEVGKTPVREALGVLQQEGLVEVVPRVGYLTSRVTLQDVDDIFDLRRIVEGAAAEKAATAITEETLQRVEQFHWDFDSGDRQSYLRFLDENLEFHCTIAAASGNRQLVEIVARLLEQMQRLVILRLDISASLEELVGEHRELLAALRQRDPARARDHRLADVTNTHQAALDSLKRLMANRHI
ncbi:MAG: GntR family transcriptional regulator [Chloroflexota bacterium]